MRDAAHRPGRWSTAENTGDNAGANATDTVSVPALPLRLVGLGALFLGAVSVFLPWATAGLDEISIRLAAGVAGVDLGAGRVFGLLLGLVGLLLVWQLSSRGGGRAAAALLFLTWLGALAVAGYELVHIVALPPRGLVTVDVGTGLFVAGLAAVLGGLAALAEFVRAWSEAGTEEALSPEHDPRSGVRGAGGAAGLVTVVALVAAGVLGVRASGRPVTVVVPNPGQHRPVAPIPSREPGGTGQSGAGDSGGSGNTGSTGNTGTGDSGNSGSGGGILGNSGSGGGIPGNSGSGGEIFGNSGNSGSGGGIFGNSGSGGGIFGNSGNT